MKFIFYSPVHFEEWNWTNSVERGIGGSETSHVEMAWRLAQRGHEVLSYAPIPSDSPSEWRGTFWKRFEEADFTEDALWVLYRCPEVLDQFGPRRPEQPRWLMCQDTHYPTMTPERAAKLDRVLALCQVHADHLGALHSYLRDRIWVTSNGVKLDLMREVLAGGMPERDPKKLIYASSPDRGLVTLLSIFRRAHEIVPDLTLHCFYGLDNIEKLLASKALWAQRHFTGLKESIATLLEQPGVVWRGRVSQRDLYREWLSAGIWAYPTEFTETSAITCMEAQALGAIPITRPLWALRDNVAWGVRLDGSPAGDPLVRARYVGEIVRLATQSALQERLRGPMMRWAQEWFNWERWVDQWEREVLGLPPGANVQFTFQHKWMRGRTLNIGCDTDVSGFLERGAVNLDVRLTSPVTRRTNRAHVIHDVREPLPACLGDFDTVILGEILEHLAWDDGVAALRRAASVLRPGGRLVVTCPDDATRTPQEQHAGVQGDEEYAPRVSAFHTRSISRADLEGQLREAGLIPMIYQPIDYTQFTGHGVVAERP